MKFYDLKRLAAILLSSMVIISLAACRGQSDLNPEPEVKTETAIRGDMAEGVILPDDFVNMEYPMKAIAMEIYHLGNPYYIQFSENSSRDSFWYSCALTAYYYYHETKDSLELDPEEFDMIVSCLYASYQEGNLEFPEIREGCGYAIYLDNETGGYRFAADDKAYVPDQLDDYFLYYTGCESGEDGFTISAELHDSNNWDLLGSYVFKAVPSQYPGEDNAFAYSIASVRDAALSDEEAATDLAEDSTEPVDGEDSETNEAAEITDDGSGEDEAEENTEEETDDIVVTLPEKVSEEDAMIMAENYYGSECEYTYQGLKNIGGDRYHLIAVSGNDISKPYILVSEKNGDVVGASMNPDGTWSFDQ